jgi:hypothetical protein
VRKKIRTTWGNPPPGRASVDFEARVLIVVLAYGQRRWKAESNLDTLVGFLEGSITSLLEFVGAIVARQSPMKI